MLAREIVTYTNCLARTLEDVKNLARKIYYMKTDTNSTFWYEASNRIYNFLIGLECNISWTTAVWVSPSIALTTRIPHNNKLVNISVFLVFPLLDLTSLSLLLTEKTVVKDIRRWGNEDQFIHHGEHFSAFVNSCIMSSVASTY